VKRNDPAPLTTDTAINSNRLKELARIVPSDIPITHNLYIRAQFSWTIVRRTNREQLRPRQSSQCRIVSGMGRSIVTGVELIGALLAGT
jgi:hypothetical protein